MVNLSKKAAGGIVEGEFSTWTYKWSNNIPDGFGIGDFDGIHLDDKDDIISLSWYDAGGPSKTRFGRFNISDFSTIFLSASGSNYAQTPDYRAYNVIRNMDKYTMFAPASALQTYVLLARLPTLEVWRGSGATPLWSRDITIDDANIVGYIGYSISPTGKYIAILVYTTASWVGSVLLYEGS